MKKKIIIPVVVVAILMVAGIAAAFVVLSKPAANNSTNPPATTEEVKIKEISKQFASDLKAAFQTGVTNAKLPELSVAMSESYAGIEGNQPEINFVTDVDNKQQFYLASTIKPLYLSAIINILQIKDLNYEVPFKFVDQDKNYTSMSQELSDTILYNYQNDPFIVDTFVPMLKELGLSSREEVKDALMNNPKFTEYKFTIKDIIKYTLGPSSNWSITLMRNHFALTQNKDEKGASDIIEAYLNKVLKDNGFTGSLILNLSTKSETDKTFNTDYFNEVEFLFEYFYQNKFNTPIETFNLMKESMRDVSENAKKENRMHEIKSMAKNVFGSKVASIIEKSGYIGLDYEAAPGFAAFNGWDKIEQVDGRRIVSFDASGFARIYLTNGNYVQFNYVVGAPISISKDPSYEELNNDYLEPKAKINESLQAAIQPVLTKYKDIIKFVN